MFENNGVEEQYLRYFAERGFLKRWHELQGLREEKTLARWSEILKAAGSNDWDALLPDNYFDLAQEVLIDEILGTYTSRTAAATVCAALLRTQRTGCKGFLLAFDARNLKTHNDLIGKEVGDMYLFALIQNVEEILSRFFSFVVTIRRGGDEFLVLCLGEDMALRFSAEAFATELANELRHQGKNTGTEKIPCLRKSGEPGIGIYLGYASLNDFAPDCQPEVPGQVYHLAGTMLDIANAQADSKKIIVPPTNALVH